MPFGATRSLRGATLGSLIVLSVLRCLGHNLSRCGAVSERWGGMGVRGYPVLSLAPLLCFFGWFWSLAPCLCVCLSVPRFFLYISLFLSSCACLSACLALSFCISLSFSRPLSSSVLVFVCISPLPLPPFLSSTNLNPNPNPQPQPSTSKPNHNPYSNPHTIIPNPPPRTPPQPQPPNPKPQSPTTIINLQHQPRHPMLNFRRLRFVLG